MTLDALEAFVLYAALGEYLVSVPEDVSTPLAAKARRIFAHLRTVPRLQSADVPVTEEDARGLLAVLRTYVPRPMPVPFKAELRALMVRIEKERGDAETV